MRVFWPTEQAKTQMPDVARGMNEMKKYVVSRTLTSVDWQNTTLLKGHLVEEVKKLKAEPGPDLTIMGSGKVVAQLTQAGLIDGYQFVVIPIILGAGRTLFDGVVRRPVLKRTDSRMFKNGSAVLTYATGNI